MKRKTHVQIIPRPCALATGLLAGSPVMADTVAYRVTDRIAGADGGWDLPASMRSAAFCMARSNAVMAIDLATHKVSNLTSADGGHQVIPIDHGATLVETDGKSGLTRFIDVASGKVVAQAPSGIKPDAAYYDDKAGAIVVMSPGNDMITTIDAKPIKSLAR
jgi:hypothetical protein